MSKKTTKQPSTAKKIDGKTLLTVRAQHADFKKLSSDMSVLQAELALARTKLDRTLSAALMAIGIHEAQAHAVNMDTGEVTPAQQQQQRPMPPGVPQRPGMPMPSR